jgi:hypothetical protein
MKIIQKDITNHVYIARIDFAYIKALMNPI